MPLVVVLSPGGWGIGRVLCLVKLVVLGGDLKVFGRVLSNAYPFRDICHEFLEDGVPIDDDISKIINTRTIVACVILFLERA